MKIEQDTKQRITTLLYMMLEIYKIMMGTFLVIFVPQECGEKICGASDNFFKGEIINTVGNVSNLSTFSAILYLYYIEMKRENWCIKYLDIDHDKSSNNLDIEIEYYPKYKNEMYTLNKKYLNATYLSIFMMITNFIISGFTVYDSYAGTNTATTFLSFFLLVSLKLYNSYNVGHTSVIFEKANSAYLKQLKTYNTIDCDFKIERVEEILKNNGINNDKETTKISNVEIEILESETSITI